MWIVRRREARGPGVRAVGAWGAGEGEGDGEEGGGWAILNGLRWCAGVDVDFGLEWTLICCSAICLCLLAKEDATVGKWGRGARENREHLFFELDAILYRA